MLELCGASLPRGKRHLKDRVGMAAYDVRPGAAEAVVAMRSERLYSRASARVRVRLAQDATAPGLLPCFVSVIKRCPPLAAYPT